MLNYKHMILNSLVILGFVGVLTACGGGGGGSGDSELVFRPDVAPSNVQVVAGEEGLDGGVMNTISWTEVPAATEYLVYWNNVDDVTENSAVVVPIRAGNDSVVHGGVEVVAGTTYYYRVQALSGGESSILSDVAVGTPQEAITSNKLNDIAWNGVDTLVAVGDSGVIVNSPNGTTDPWTSAAVNPAGENHLSGVTWEDVNVQFLIVGAGGTVLTGDGATWNLEDWEDEGSAVTSDLEDVAWSVDRYIAVGKDGTIITSPDGRFWTQRDPPSSVTTITLNGVASDGNRVVVVGTNGTMLTSDDVGVSWSELDKITNNELNDITWDGSRFAVVGSDGTVLSSPDGVDWIEHIEVQLDNTFVGASQWDSGLPEEPIALAAVGSSGDFMVSPDSVSDFMMVRTGTLKILSAVTWVEGSNPYFVIVGQDGTVLTNQQ